MSNPSCTRCGKVLQESPWEFAPQAVVIGRFPVLYKGVVCVTCGHIDCTECKGDALETPCSACGGRVTPATQDALNRAPRKASARPSSKQWWQFWK